MLGVCRASGQDLHFSQWFNSPLSTNPANTGFIPDADYRLGANYRNQWSAIMAMPYRTFSIWGDAQVFRDRGLHIALDHLPDLLAQTHARHQIGDEGFGFGIYEAGAVGFRPELGMGDC